MMRAVRDKSRTTSITINPDQEAVIDLLKRRKIITSASHFYHRAAEEWVGQLRREQPGLFADDEGQAA